MYTHTHTKCTYERTQSASETMAPQRLPGPHTMLCCTRHLSAVRAVWSALSTQCTVNLEHSNTLNTQCTRSNGHSTLSVTHLTGTECSVRASCVVPCAREPRRPPWSSLSLSLPLTRSLPRLDLPVSVLACDVRKPIETFGRELESVVPRFFNLRSNLSKRSQKH